MKPFPMILTTTVAFLLGSAAMLPAGVVMSETALSSGPIGNRPEHRTIYVQGNKQKIDMDGVQTITDLDKHRLYIVDKDHRNYAEIPLEYLPELLPGGDKSDSGAIALKRTGATRVIADNRCNEYHGNKGNDHVQITISACVSKGAPGAAEIVRFDQDMVSQLPGFKLRTSKEEATGIVLEKESVVNFRLPDPSQKGYRITSLTTNTKVNDIKLKRLPAQTFAPPKGYKKVKPQPSMSVPQDVQSIVSKQGRSQPAPSAHSES